MTKLSRLLTHLEEIEPPWFVFLSDTTRDTKLYELWSVEPLHLFATYNLPVPPVYGSRYNFVVWQNESMTYKKLNHAWDDEIINEATKYVRGPGLGWRRTMLGEIALSGGFTGDYSSEVHKAYEGSTEIRFPDDKFKMGDLRRNIPAIVEGIMHERPTHYYSQGAFSSVSKEDLDMVNFDVIVNSRYKS